MKIFDTRCRTVACFSLFVSLSAQVIHTQFFAQKHRRSLTVSVDGSSKRKDQYTVGFITQLLLNGLKLSLIRNRRVTRISIIGTLSADRLSPCDCIFYHKHNVHQCYFDFDMPYPELTA